MDNYESTDDSSFASADISNGYEESWIPPNAPLRDFMLVVNKVQSLCSRLENDGISIPIPRIVVVGDQSSGKSSLLEQIAQEQFLPTGSGTVTRCPLELQFLKSETKKFSVNRAGNFKLECVSNAEARAAITHQSDMICKKAGGFSNETIPVEICSPNVPNMTLVDLPGLIQSPSMLDGTYDPEAPAKIERMARKYIAEPNTIILLVAKANEDILNSNGMKLVKEIDPEGTRTLAVLTHLDKISPRDDMEFLSYNLAQGSSHINLGVIAVVSRFGKISFEESRKTEQSCLAKLFGVEERKRHGVDYLGQRLSFFQTKRIQESLVQIMGIIKSHLREQEAILEKIGFGHIGDKQEMLFRALSQFLQDFIFQLIGGNRNFYIRDFSGGTKIKRLLDHDLFAQLSTLQALDEVSDDTIIFAIAMQKGQLLVII